MPTEQREQGGTGVVVFGVALGLLPLLYVLSFGPAAWLVVNDYLSQEAFGMVYFLLIFVGCHSTLVAAALEWYAHLCGA